MELLENLELKLRDDDCIAAFTFQAQICVVPSGRVRIFGCA